MRFSSLDSLNKFLSLAAAYKHHFERIKQLNARVSSVRDTKQISAVRTFKFILPPLIKTGDGTHACHTVTVLLLLPKALC